jgi:hypothetical protein
MVDWFKTESGRGQCMVTTKVDPEDFRLNARLGQLFQLIDPGVAADDYPREFWEWMTTRYTNLAPTTGVHFSKRDIQLRYAVWFRDQHPYDVPAVQALRDAENKETAVNKALRRQPGDDAPEASTFELWPTLYCKCGIALEYRGRGLNGLVEHVFHDKLNGACELEGKKFEIPVVVLRRIP